MRTYGRTYSGGVPTWVEVDTDAQGYNDAVYETTLCQVLKLQPNESPFDANYGIPAQQSVMTSIFPNFYVNRTQAQFAQFFASLVITLVTGKTPTYNVQIVTNQGFVPDMSQIPQ